MTGEQLRTEVYNVIDSIDSGYTNKDEALLQILDSFARLLESIPKTSKTLGHFQLFIYRVKTMRDEQIKYDNGDYKARIVAKRMEVQVDNAISKLVNDLGYNIGDIQKKYEQQKLL